MYSYPISLNPIFFVIIENWDVSATERAKNNIKLYTVCPGSSDPFDLKLQFCDYFTGNGQNIKIRIKKYINLSFDLYTKNYMYSIYVLNSWWWSSDLELWLRFYNLFWFNEKPLIYYSWI